MSDDHGNSSPGNGSSPKASSKDFTNLPLFGVKEAIKENKKERQLKDQTSPSKEVLPFLLDSMRGSLRFFMTSTGKRDETYVISS